MEYLFPGIVEKIFSPGAKISTELSFEFIFPFEKSLIEYFSPTEPTTITLSEISGYVFNVLIVLYTELYLADTLCTVIFFHSVCFHKKYASY